MALELERKFLVKQMPDDLPKKSAMFISQSYLVTGEEEVRVRGYGRKYYLTIKKGVGEMGVRQEHELEITKETAGSLFSLTPCKSLQKRRYQGVLTKPKGQKFCIDVYTNPEIKGLRVVEFEFDNKADMKCFEPPEWAGLEVTGWDDFKNQSLWRRINASSTEGEKTPLNNGEAGDCMPWTDS